MDKNFDSYRKAFEDAQSELEELLEEDSLLAERRGKIMLRSESLRKISESIGSLLGENLSKQAVGLTDTIRNLLGMDAGTWYSATNVRTYLRNEEFPIDDYQQPLAVIHTTLKRLQDQGEILSQEMDGKAYYRWDGPPLMDVGVTDDDIPF